MVEYIINSSEKIFNELKVKKIVSSKLKWYNKKNQIFIQPLKHKKSEFIIFGGRILWKRCSQITPETNPEGTEGPQLTILLEINDSASKYNQSSDKESLHCLSKNYSLRTSNGKNYFIWMLIVNFKKINCCNPSTSH